MSDLLKAFKAFHANRFDLMTEYGTDLLNAKSDDVEIVYSIDVISAIKKFRADEISIHTLVDWVNTLWFDDGLYTYCEEQCDSIASVMTELETLDEEGVFFTDDEYTRMIAALESNIEFVLRPSSVIRE